jgi:hypothetical protein
MRSVLEIGRSGKVNHARAKDICDLPLEIMDMDSNTGTDMSN